LRIVYPAASRAREVCTFIHSKVMLVDDRFVRIGSANFSHRSMSVDSECDLAIDAGSNSVHRAGVRRIRDRLLGEHLGISADTVALDVHRLGSLRAVVDARGDVDRTLCRVPLGEPTEPPPEILKAAADPDEPLGVMADGWYRRQWRRARSIGRVMRSLLPIRVSSASGRRRRSDAEFG
jgi:phosphatidylserine/phosphatidylglycerophosphate/cardiolipin synthase-like enzyme